MQVGCNNREKEKMKTRECFPFKKKKPRRAEKMSAEVKKEIR